MLKYFTLALLILGANSALAQSDASKLIGTWQVGECYNNPAQIHQKSTLQEIEFLRDQTMVERTKIYNGPNCAGSTSRAAEAVAQYRIVGVRPDGAMELFILSTNASGDLMTRRELIKLSAGGDTFVFGKSDNAGQFPTQLDDSVVMSRVKK